VQRQGSQVVATHGENIERIKLHLVVVLAKRCGPSRRRERNASAALRKFRPSAKKDFFNTIRQYRKYRTRRCGVGISSGTTFAFNPTGEERDVWVRAPWDVRQKGVTAFLAGRGAKYRRAQALAVNSTSRSLCRTGAMPPMT
jgi:hypothetical protein